MSSSDVAISVRGLSKAYTIAHQAPKHTTLGEALLHRLRHPFKRAEKEVFWALNDVSFDIKRGEVVGVIGRNGAGKSTLLKILSRITEPTKGEIDLYGRVGSLLEVGTGFHQELTGRENIYLNGAVLGMTRGEIRKQFDAIVDFAGVEQFLDTPVKRYSSGMYVRLAFAVAAHLRSEILIVDEVLAVGDAEFQKKCLGKMKDVASDGRTVMVVSHNMQSILSLCDLALLLSGGALAANGAVRDVVRLYGAPQHGVSYQFVDDGSVRRRGTGQYRIEAAKCDRTTYNSGDEIVLFLRARRRGDPVVALFLIADIADALGTTLIHTDSRMCGVTFKDAKEMAVEYRLRSPWLKPGTYSITLQLGAGGLVDEVVDACMFEVIGGPYSGTLQPESSGRGLVFADFQVGRHVPDAAVRPTPSVVVTTE